MKQRVVITGMGCVTPLGQGVDVLWEGIRRNSTGIKPTDIPDFPIRWAGYVDGSLDHDLGQRAKRFALQATQEALLCAGLTRETVSLSDMAICVSCSKWPALVYLDQLLGGSSSCGCRSDLISPGQSVAQWFCQDVHQLVELINCASSCVTGLSSIVHGFHLIQSGYKTTVLSGATEAVLCPFLVEAYKSMGVLSCGCDRGPEFFRPFDQRRDGFIPGEGAGVLLLESLESAQIRDAKIFAEVVYGRSFSDAHQMTYSDPSGSTLVDGIRTAINGASIEPESHVYVNTHGTGTKKNDTLETCVLERAFDQSGVRLTVHASKPITAHLLGASGAVEAIICCKVLNQGGVPCVAQPAVPLKGWSFCSGKSQDISVNFALKLSHGFGGHSGILMLKRYNGE